MKRQTDKNHPFNLLYKVKDNPRRDGYTPYHGSYTEAYPHFVGMEMSLDQYIEAEEKLRKSPVFLELAAHKLESPQYDPESVQRINNFAHVFGGPLTRMLPDATTNMGFGQMYLRIYVRRDQTGIVTVLSSTGNEYANEICFYLFKESVFKETIKELGLTV